MQVQISDTKQIIQQWQQITKHQHILNKLDLLIEIMVLNANKSAVIEVK
jgi:hypothetical protein